MIWESVICDGTEKQKCLASAYLARFQSNSADGRNFSGLFIIYAGVARNIKICSRIFSSLWKYKIYGLDLSRYSLL